MKLNVNSKVSFLVIDINILIHIILSNDSNIHELIIVDEKEVKHKFLQKKNDIIDEKWYKSKDDILVKERVFSCE